MKAKTFAGLAIMATGVGILSGLFGVGGGVVLVPLLVWIFDYDQHRAQGTSLIALVPPTGLLAVLQYYKHGYVNTAAGLLLIPGVFLGGLIGGIWAQKISAGNMRRIFAGFLLMLGVWQIAEVWMRK